MRSSGTTAPRSTWADLGGSVDKAGAINDRGEIAGLASLPGDTAVHAYLWNPNGKKMQDLGPSARTLADPAGINNSTQIVAGRATMPATAGDSSGNGKMTTSMICRAGLGP